MSERTAAPDGHHVALAHVAHFARVPAAGAGIQRASCDGHTLPQNPLCSVQQSHHEVHAGYHIEVRDGGGVLPPSCNHNSGDDKHNY